MKLKNKINQSDSLLPFSWANSGSSQGVNHMHTNTYSERSASLSIFKETKLHRHKDTHIGLLVKPLIIDSAM